MDRPSVDLCPPGTVVVIVSLCLLVLSTVHYCLVFRTRVPLDSIVVRLAGCQEGRYARP